MNNDEVRVIWYWCYVNNIDAPLYIYCESWKKLQKAFKFLQIQHLYQVLTPDPPWGLWGPLLSFFPPPSLFFFFFGGVQCVAPAGDQTDLPSPGNPSPHSFNVATASPGGQTELIQPSKLHTLLL